MFGIIHLRFGRGDELWGAAVKQDKELALAIIIAGYFIKSYYIFLTELDN